MSLTMRGRKAQHPAAGVGFTQVELLVVIGIIALLGAVLLPSVESARNKARPARAGRQITSAVAAVEAYTCGSPDAGSCFEGHPNPFCSDSACCARVCGQIPGCCQISWNVDCAGIAQRICQPPVGACCADGCHIMDRSTCNSIGGPYLGDGTVCPPTGGLCIMNTPCQDCGPGPHWIDQCLGGSDLMPTGALVGISTNPTSCVPNLNLVMDGPVSISRSNPLDVSNNFPGIGALDHHLDVIDTEIISMLLQSNGIILRAGWSVVGAPIRPSLGVIFETPGAPPMADSFFDVFVEIQLPTGQLLYNQSPLRVKSGITCVPPDANYLHPDGCVRLFTSPVPGTGLPIANLTSANHSTFPACGDPATGECLQPHDTPFCNKVECCQQVCSIATLAYCCTQTWDERCAVAARQICLAPEACCMHSGDCVQLPADDCRLQGGVPEGPGTSCTSVACPQPTGACCAQGACTQAGNCTARFDTCDGRLECKCFELAEGGPSCTSDFPCFGQTLCPHGTSDCPAGQVCLINTCCGAPTCAPEGCAGATPTAALPVGNGEMASGQGGETAAIIAGECIELTKSSCQDIGGVFHGADTMCDGVQCALAEACCLPTGGCQVMDPQQCRALDGVPQGRTGACRGDHNGNGIDDVCEPGPPCADCGGVAHWVDQCPGGMDVMPTGAEVGIDRTGDCIADLSAVLSGPVTITRSAARDDSTQFPGLRPVDGHLDVIDTEIVSLNLTGSGLTLRAGAGYGHGGILQPSFGAIAEQTGNALVADSFFDVFFEVDLGSGHFAYNWSPVRVQANLTCLPPQVTYIHVIECIPLYPTPFPTEFRLPVAFLTEARHGTYPTCGSDVTGDCSQPHDTPFCNKGECCSRVCELRPSCCTQAWDESCVAAAEVVCNPGACCLPRTCAQGGVCGQFQNCGAVGPAPCLCFSAAEGGGNCAADYACATSAPCPNGTNDCPAGQICYVNTCCGRPACGPATCLPTTADAGAPAVEPAILAPGAGPTAAGGQGTVGGEIIVPPLGCIVTDRLRCDALGGTYEGNGTVCTPQTCGRATEVDYFPNTTAVIELQSPNGGSMPISLSGPTTVHVFFEGPNEGDANDSNGNGLDDVATEMVDMQLTGNSPLGPVVVRLNPNIPSRGQIEETVNTQPGRLDLPPFAPTGTANSFFDVFFEIEVGGMRLHTATPKRMSSVINHKPPAQGDTYENLEKIQLLDANGNPTGFSIGAGRHTPRPPIEVDYFPNTTAVMELQSPNGGSVPISLSGPTTVHVFFEGPNEGDARDDDGNGLDEVQTQMVDMQLAGNSPLGPVVVRLNPNIPSRGQIEETANTQPGRLDLPPFAPTGTANSFFDVFFEIEIQTPNGPLLLHTQSPKRMSSVINHKPPAQGDTYENLEKIQLFDANGNPTGFSIGAGRHTPRPPVEVDYFPNTTAVMELQSPNGGSVPISLAGPTTVHVFFEGPNEGDAHDDDGNGLDEVQTVMVDMQLTGNSPLGPVVVRLNPNIPSRGQIEETANTQPGRLDLPPFAPTGTANSFFDVFFEIEIQRPNGPLVLFTHSPKRMSSVINHKPPAQGDTYENLEKIQLFDASGNPTPYSIGAGRHTPRPPVEVDYFPNTTAVMELQFPGGSEVIHLGGPTTVHVFFEGQNEGDAVDNDGNGLDEVRTEMVDMQLTGISSLFGPVLVTLNPAIPSRGQIEETANTQPGRLDLPPFAPTGTANSFFDVFFEIRVGPFVFHTATPKRMSSVITHKPPAPGDTYENPEKIPLLDANGNPTGLSIAAGRHTPNPALPEACCLPNGTCEVTLADRCRQAGGVPRGPNSQCLGDANGNGIDDACEPERPCQSCGGFPHWIDQCPGGFDDMPTGALVGIDLNGDCQADVSAVLNGPVHIARRPASDDSLFYPGLRPIDGHLDVIDTEIVAMELTGGGLTLRAGAGFGHGGVLRPSRGAIAEDPANALLGHSFFDVFFEVDLGGGQFAYNWTPVKVEADVTCLPPQVTYIHVLACIPLYPTPFPNPVVRPVAFLAEARHGTYPTCGSDATGDCSTPHDTPFCNKGDCCHLVCELVPDCCGIAWSQLCASVAHDVCGPSQACCMPSGSCKDAPPTLCESASGTPHGEGSTCENTRCPQAGDCRVDGRVDLRDVARFQNCFTGSGGHVRRECHCADLDADGDVDLVDWRVFRELRTGP